MNQHLQDFARNFIKERLKQLPADQQLFYNRMYSHKNLDATVEEAVDGTPADKLDWAMQQVEAGYGAAIVKGTVEKAPVFAAPDVEAARKFLQLYGQPRPGYDTTVSGMADHLAAQGHPNALPDWVYTTGGPLLPEQALHWLAYLFAVGPVAPAATDTAEETPAGHTWRCRDCFGPLGEEHSENCGIGRATIARADCGDCPVKDLVD